MTDAAELFEAYGFEKLESGVWRFAKDFTETDAEVSQENLAVVIVEEKSDGSFVGHVPFVSSQNMDLADVPERSLFFPSSDPRDMVALAQNEAGNSFCQATGHFPEEGFGDDEDGMFITFPFMSDPWSDYALVATAKQEDPRYELVSPADVFNGYVAWRDEFCEKVIAKAQAPST
ncbi:hypothetical protein D3C71_217060 [compost metagenome]